MTPTPPGVSGIAVTSRAKANTASTSAQLTSEVVDLLLGNPVLTAGRVERELAVTNAGALNLIRQLESLEDVQDVGRTGRGGRRVWVAHDVLAVLEGRSGDTSLRVT
ncbi:MAG: helix-turn-helix domain-containing protein [Acidimicrobiales bacterium]